MRAPQRLFIMRNWALRFLILTCLFKVALCWLNIYVRDRVTWSEAREYCRRHHHDLSSISNQEENKTFFTVNGPNISVRGWIGLYKDADDMWKWSGRENTSYFNWPHKQNNSEDGRCVMQHRGGWKKMNCKERSYFYCQDSQMVLVKENQTWEEAMEHCCRQHVGLVSLRSESALAEALQISREAQTDHVWIGLRYLADRWLWLKKGNKSNQAWSQEEMPQCPTWSHRCGALSLDGQHWESEDCAEKLNFVCYKKT